MSSFVSPINEEDTRIVHMLFDRLNESRSDLSSSPDKEVILRIICSDFCKAIFISEVADSVQPDGPIVAICDGLFEIPPKVVEQHPV